MRLSHANGTGGGGKKRIPWDTNEVSEQIFTRTYESWSFNT